MLQYKKEKMWHLSQLSTVSCQLLTLPKHSQEIFPGSLQSVCPVNTWENIIFRQFSKGHYFSRDLRQFHDIWQQQNIQDFSVMKFGMNFFKFFFNKIFLRTSLTFLSWKFTFTCDQLSSPVITCQPTRNTRPAACKMSGLFDSAVCVW